MRNILASMIALTLSFPAAASTLAVDVTRGANAGETVWTFSGSATATQSGEFSADSGFRFNEQIENIGNFTDLNTFDVPADGGSVSGNARGRVTFASKAQGPLVVSQLFDIDSIFIDTDPGTNNPSDTDDIGFGVAGVNDIAFSAGDIISWGGSLTVTGFSIENLTQGGFTNTLTASAPFAFQLNIDLAPVPVPASLPLLAGAMGTAVWAARRKKRKAA